MQITDATAFIPRSIDAVLAHHVRAWLCKERKLDVKEQKYCQYEMLGACNDDTCGRLHESSFIPSGTYPLSFRCFSLRVKPVPAAGQCLAGQPIFSSRVMASVLMVCLSSVAEDAVNFVNAVYGEPAGSKLSSARKEVYEQGLRLIIGRHFPAPSKKAIKETSRPRKWSSGIREMLRAAKAYYDSESAHLAPGSLH